MELDSSVAWEWDCSYQGCNHFMSYMWSPLPAAPWSCVVKVATCGSFQCGSWLFAIFCNGSF